MNKQPQKRRMVPDSTKSDRTQTKDFEKLLRSGATAKILDVSEDTLARWRMKGCGPRFCKFHGSKQAIIRYRLSDIIEFIDISTRNSTSDTGSDTDACV